MDLSFLPSLKDVISMHDLRAKKSLGQNFLMDPAITARIVSSAGDISHAHVTEVGPGPGGLTRSILAADPAHVTVIEFDPRAVAAIQDLNTATHADMDIIRADALKVDYTALLRAGGDKARVIISNLPYNISVVLLMTWMRVVANDPGAIARMILMFQKEVADRIMAPHGSRDYGRVSVLVQFLCDVDHVLTLPPGAFVPPPKVHSSVLRFTPKMRRVDLPSFDTLDHVVTQAFSHRRKMLRGVMKDYLEALEEAGIDSTLRAEDVSVEDYIRLAKIIEDHP